MDLKDEIKLSALKMLMSNLETLEKECPAEEKEDAILCSKEIVQNMIWEHEILFGGKNV